MYTFTCLRVLVCIYLYVYTCIYTFIILPMLSIYRMYYICMLLEPKMCYIIIHISYITYILNLGFRHHSYLGRLVSLAMGQVGGTEVRLHKCIHTIIQYSIRIHYAVLYAILYYTLYYTMLRYTVPFVSYTLYYISVFYYNIHPIL